MDPSREIHEAATFSIHACPLLFAERGEHGDVQ
jgi:hypothetical protein